MLNYGLHFAPDAGPQPCVPGPPIRSPRRIQLRASVTRTFWNVPISASSPGNSTMMLLSVRPQSSPFFALALLDEHALRAADHCRTAPRRDFLLHREKLGKPLRFFLIRHRVLHRRGFCTGARRKINVTAR